MIALSDVIATVESGKRLTAMRFEPALFASRPGWIVNQLQKIQYAHGGSSACDTDTALMIGCTSYGYFQILGANIYASGNFKGNIFTYVSSLGTQQAAFNSFIASNGFHASDDLSTWSEERFETFVNFYNGPGNVASYVAAMRKAAGLANIT